MLPQPFPSVLGPSNDCHSTTRKNVLGLCNTVPAVMNQVRNMIMVVVTYVAAQVIDFT